MIINILFAFSFFSILGWILEFFYRSLRNKRFVNPGLLKGPYLIIYGTGSLILMVCVSLLFESSWITKTFVYFVATTGLELITGLIGQNFFHLRLWNYSDQRFQYKGHVCLRFSVYWILLAFGFEYIVHTPFQNLLNWLPPGIKALFTVLLILLMLIDFVIVSIKQFLSERTLEEKEVLEIEYMNTAKPLLENPSLKVLSQYNHHRGKTRLEHVNEVAFLSFQLGKKLSLDCDAIIRGALLHDLFYYDWLREGPRLHGLRHHNIALKNARKIISLSKKEEDIIIKHMWPLTLIPPRYKESFIVSQVDTFCSLRDYVRIK